MPAFFTRFNKRFSVAAESPVLAYGPRLSKAEADAAICFKHERVVHRDNIVRLEGLVLQILPGPNRLGYAKATVTIRESLDARYSVYYKGKHLPAKLMPARLLVVPNGIKKLGSLTPVEITEAAPPAASTPDPSHTPPDWPV